LRLKRDPEFSSVLSKKKIISISSKRTSLLYELVSPNRDGISRKVRIPYRRRIPIPNPYPNPYPKPNRIRIESVSPNLDEISRKVRIPYRRRILPPTRPWRRVWPLRRERRRLPSELQRRRRRERPRRRISPGWPASP